MKRPNDDVHECADCGRRVFALAVLYDEEGNQGDDYPDYTMWLMCEECQDMLRANDVRTDYLDDMTYSEYLQSEHWKIVRQIVIKHRKSCACCGSTLQLHVHHREYPVKRGEIMSYMLVLLCKRCHGAIHGKN